MSRIGGRFVSGMLPPYEFGIRGVRRGHRWKLTITEKPPVVCDRGHFMFWWESSIRRKAFT